MSIQIACQICYDEKSLAQLDCQCKICLDCLKNYTKIKIEEYWTADGQHINMNCAGGCQKILYFEQIEQLAIDNKYISEIHEQLFKSYCKKSIDIQQCPNKNCEFYYLKPCKVNCELICENCQTRLLNFEQLSIKNILNEITEFSTTHQCPRCEVKITKNGGCSHMTCQFCKYEFCWDCKQNCKYHDWSICIYNNIFTLIIKIQLIYTILYSIGLHPYIILLFGYIYQITYLFILNNIILLLNGLILIQLKKINEKYEKITYHRIMFALITNCILISISYFIIQQSIIEYIIYIFKEIFYIIITIIIITILNQLSKQLFQKN